jgi:RimJ/RimL family protein N-acetyltransferase
MPTNDFGQPIGPALPNWTARPHPPRTSIAGRFCRVEPLDAAAHAEDLFVRLASLRDGRWTYLPYGPFDTREHFQRWIAEAETSVDPLFHAIANPAGHAIGVAAYMRIDRANGVIEAGHLNFSPALQRTPAATEAMYLMLRRAFDELGYRRFEWKCDSFNAPSRRAAARFGFTYEGLFRQAIVYRQRSRDTTWFSIIDAEWPARKAAFEAWLAPDNFDAAGLQRRPLSAFMPASTFRYDLEQEIERD